ncbi:metabotropic glutamate receptor [Elysia marginata]|uniref:Metabotropic glutamate receptor n=1 Tax=Elysia marginata TaxID=1093978 RepID=A0AAV4EF51_9GAST|nr:metabotropic glutamate receptor [Elysia marginata]
MASGRELCYILLFGISISYITSVAMLARPSMFTCLIRRFALGVSLCFVYAAILTKTNRIFRIFSVGIKAMVKRPSYTSPKSQIFICLALVSVQVVGAFTWLGFEKPDVMLTHHQKGQLVLRCRASQIATIVSLLYNIFLIILCTVYAFKTRKIPQNFNEAKYIAFTMYSTCIVWVAFVPIYFGANHDFKIEVTSLCMCVNISATVALFCLFAPKVYIVLLQPHKNVRQTSAASLSTSGKTTARNFYDPSTASTGLSGGGRDGPAVGGGVYSRTMSSSSYSDLNGGVYCGEPPSNPLPFLTPKSAITSSSHGSSGVPGTTVVMTTTQASVPPQQQQQHHHHLSSSSPTTPSARDFRKRNSAGHVILYTPPSPPNSSPYSGLVVHPSPAYYSRDAHCVDNEIIEEDEDMIEDEKKNIYIEEEEEEEEEAGEEDGMITHVTTNSPKKWTRLYEGTNGAGALLCEMATGFPERNHHEGKRPHMVPMCRHSCHTHPLPPLDDWGREDAEDSSSCDESRPARMLVTDIS